MENQLGLGEKHSSFLLTPSGVPFTQSHASLSPSSWAPSTYNTPSAFSIGVGVMACLRLLWLLVLTLLHRETKSVKIQLKLDPFHLKHRDNFTSRETVFGKRSFVELESIQSNTCFNGGGCGHPITPLSASCNPGAYIYQITGYSGGNYQNGNFATRFDITCSDGNSYSIGELGSFNVTNTTIINPNGYQSVLADGGCITDHIQIGGTDFGNPIFSSLSSCNCTAGLRFVGFPTINYMTYWPSFPTMSILCDISCPKGSYYSNGSCFDCDPGTYSFPGSVGSGSCFSILTNVGNGGAFALQISGLNTYLSAIYNSPVVTESTYDPQNSNLLFTYNQTSLQIMNLGNGLCLDDEGNEAMGPSSINATLSFSTCDPTTINQQFIFNTGNQIYNPNWPNNKICLRGDGGNAFNGHQELILWQCDPRSFNETFEVLIVCPSGCNPY